MIDHAPAPYIETLSSVVHHRFMPVGVPGEWLATQVECGLVVKGWTTAEVDEDATECQRCRKHHDRLEERKARRARR